MKRTPNLDIRFDSLVVEGVHVSPRHSRVLQAAMQQELARLIARNPGALTSASTVLPSVVAPTLRIASPAPPPAALGRAIGRSLYELLTRPL